MPTFNITLEDTSPMIRYSTNWRAGTSADDPTTVQYSEASFTVTAGQGETLEFDFYGTTITMFGAKRGNHGLYSGQLDGGFVFTGNGSGPDAFKQALYTANSTLGSHTMKITNGGNTFFDIDYVTFQTNVGLDDEDLIVNTFQDGHPSFAYTPSSLWYTTTDTVSWFSGGNGQCDVLYSFTNESSAVVKFTFQGEYNEVGEGRFSLVDLVRSGDAVALYGSVGPQGGDYTVQLNNNATGVYSGKKTFFRPKEVLFYAGNLGAGNHSLQLQLSSSSLAELSIDYADVYTSQSLRGSYLGSTLPPPSNISKTPTSIIAALIVTSVVALITTLTLVYMFWRRRREASSQKAIPVLPMGYNFTHGTPIVSAALPSVNHAGSSTTVTTSGFSYPSVPVPSSGGVTSSSTSSRAVVGSSTSRYLPQGKRNAAVANAHWGMMPSDVDGAEIREGRNIEIYPPQYSEG